MAALLRTIVIVGGGFSGTVVAANLLRRPPAGPTRLVLIERANEVARGAAYAERGFPYLLNVPASRMSANSAAPKEFLEFAQRRMPKATGEDFLPRPLYGEYLDEVLLAAKLSAPRNIRLEVVHGSVTNIRRIERHLPLQVELDGGRRFTADDVVLALGNPKPAAFAAAKDVLGHPAYVADPWATDLKFKREQTVLLIGTGLTAADIINVASSDPQRLPNLHALSRHGLVPPRQTPFRPDAFKGDGNALLLAASTSLRGLTSSVRLLANEAEKMGGDWREAITFVRNMAPTIWQRLPERDRVRFLRHVRAHWDIHRHRLPPELIQKIDALRSAQQLHDSRGSHQRIHSARRSDRSDLASARHATAANSAVRSRDQLHRARLRDRALDRSALAQPRAMRIVRGGFPRPGPAHRTEWRGRRCRRLARPASFLCRADAARRSLGGNRGTRTARSRGKTCGLSGYGAALTP